MDRGSGSPNLLYLLALLLASLAGTACEHRYYRVYDPYYTDYHVWNDEETRYYHQWTAETHRDHDREFRKLRPEEQKDYWTWRHNHGNYDDRNRQ